MTFTDDDLARLKEKVFAVPKADWVPPIEQPAYYKALIYRLEAAEEALMATCECEPVDHPDKCAETIAWNKWCEAAGK